MPPPKPCFKRLGGKTVAAGGTDGLRVLKSAFPCRKRSDVAYLAIPDDRHLVLCPAIPPRTLAATPRESYLADPGTENF